MAVSVGLDCRVAPHDTELLEAVESIAQACGRPIRPLHLQALLQLPRVADADGLVPLSTVRAVVSDLAIELPTADQWAVTRLYRSPRELKMCRLDHDVVADVMSRFHYLRSPRVDGQPYGLVTSTGETVAACVSSPVDVTMLADLLEKGERPSKTARVISRVFVFQGAPKNSISYLLARACAAEAELGATDFVTYVNPNMGFAGSSYLASGWSLLGQETGTTYRYLDRRYITDRRLAGLFGTHSDEGYAQLAGGRFAVSRMSLLPLLVFHVKAPATILK